MTNRKTTTVRKRMGARIKGLREEKGLNQTDFGKLFNLTQNDVTNIEQGYKTVSYELLIDISNYFGVTTDYLIKENGVRGNNPELQAICNYTGLSEETIVTLNGRYLKHGLLTTRFIRYIESIIDCGAALNIRLDKIHDLMLTRYDLYDDHELTYQDRTINEAERNKKLKDIEGTISDLETYVDGEKYGISRLFAHELDDCLDREFDDLLDKEKLYLRRLIELSK